MWGAWPPPPAEQSRGIGSEEIPVTKGVQYREVDEVARDVHPSGEPIRRERDVDGGLQRKLQRDERQVISPSSIAKREAIGKLGVGDESRDEGESHAGSPVHRVNPRTIHTGTVYYVVSLRFASLRLNEREQGFTKEARVKLCVEERGQSEVFLRVTGFYSPPLSHLPPSPRLLTMAANKSVPWPI